MKKLKYILLLVVMCVAFSATGIAIADTAYPDGKGLDGVSSTSVGQTYVAVNDVLNAELIVKHQIGGGAGIGCCYDVKVNLLADTTNFQVGLVGVQDGQKDFLQFWDNAGVLNLAGKANGEYVSGEDSSVQVPFVGEVTFRLELNDYGEITFSCFVPSSNTQMNSSVQRDAWIVIAEDHYGYFLNRYAKVGGSAQNIPAYLYFSFNNVEYHEVSIAPKGGSTFGSFADNFANPTTFETNFTGNDAFNQGVQDKKIVLPYSGDVVISESSVENVMSLVNANTLGKNFIRSEKSYKGALTIDLYANTVGPNLVLGMLSDTTQKLSYVTMDFNGYGVFREEVFYAGDYNKSHWAGILSEDTSKFYNSGNMNIAGGDVKVTLKINANGTGDIYLTYLTQTTGSGLNATPYKLGNTIGDWFSDIVVNGGKIVFAGQTSIWNNGTVIDKIVVKDGNDVVITEDDFSTNNFNGNGLQLWKTVAENHRLPGVDGITVKNNAIVSLDKQNALTDLEVFNLAVNVKATSGSYAIFTGMTEKGNVSTAKNSITFSKDAIEYAVGTTSSALTFDGDFDNANANLIKITAVKKTGVATLKIGDTLIAELENFDVDGYVGIQANDSNITYISASVKTPSAPEVVVSSNVETTVGKAVDLTPSVIDEIYSIEDMTVEVKVDGNIITDYHSYSFVNAGTYTVTYLVTNPMGQSGSAEISVQVAYAPPTIDVSGIEKYYYSLDEITFAPVVTDSAFGQVQVTMVITEGEQEVNGVDGLKFTPEKEGIYTVTFTATNEVNLSSTATVEIVVCSGGIQTDIYSKFESSDYSGFDTENVTAGENCGVIGAQGRFGTAKNIRNFVLMVRITDISLDCTDITIYLAKAPDSEYSITFTKGSTKVTVVDASGSTETEIGVDVFSAIGEGSLVIQLIFIGGEAELSFMYGNLPYEILNTPVATIEFDSAKYGKTGISSVSGGVTLDRFVVINYSTYDEIPDDIVPPDPEKPDTPSDGGDKDNEKGCSCGGSIASTFGGLICLAVAGLFVTKKRKN